ncbi:MAG: autotransporter outer membrane beta-barrel domain-containing protein [Nitrospira sp.]|nr:autotransporter outer membrane beta-barrel domain-containing protein [Nitrospira sp.]
MKNTLSIGKNGCLVLLLIAILPSKAPAQVLNDKVNSLLDAKCAGLGLPLDGNGNPITTELGRNLAKICDNQVGASEGAITGGGGAASFQGSAASILNRLLLQRLDETDEEEGQTQTRSSSMRLNPFGSLLSGSAGTSSLSSPFYAATTADGGSAATFTSSSQRRWNGLGLFASGLVESLNRDITTFQDGFKSTIFGFSGGADYRFSRKLVAGLAFSYSNSDGNFSSGGNFSTNSYGGLLFASYLPTDRTFMQVSGGYTRNNYLISRLATARIGTDPCSPTSMNCVAGDASSNSNGNLLTLGLLTGYDHPIGRFTIGPRAGVTYSNTHIGGYTENGSTGIELKYNDQWINSLQSVLGVQGSAAFSTSFAVLVPQFNADYIHEFANNQRFINVQFAQDLRGTMGFPGAPTKFTFQTDVPVRNYFNLGTGLVMVLPNGWQLFGNFRAMVGNEQFNNYAGTFGLRRAL